MKKTLLFLLILAFGGAAQAQLYKLEGINVEKYDGSAFRNSDSAWYMYSGNHQGITSWQWLDGAVRAANIRDSIFRVTPSLQFDSMYIFRASNAGVYNGVLQYDQSLNGNRIDESRRFSWNHVTGMKVYTTKATYTYNTNSALTELVAGGLRYTWQYTGTGLLDTMKFYYWINGTGPWTLSSIRGYAYDNNKLRATYGMMANNTITDSVLYTYDVNNFLESVTSFHGAPTNDTVRQYLYTFIPGGDLVNETERRDVQGQLTNWERHLNTFDTKHHKTEDITQHWNSATQQWDNFSRGTYTYNSFELPEMYLSEQYDAGTSTWMHAADTADFRTSHRIRMHYRLFWQVGVDEARTSNADVKLYPLPAAGVITISANFKQAQAFKATITDMQGRTIMQWSETPTQQYTRTIPLAGLPAGIYILRLEGNKERAVRQFVVQ